MKKVLFTAFCFGCLTASTAFAQTGESKGASESAVSPVLTPSNARGKTPSKGSPLLQRTTGNESGVNTPAAPAATKTPPTAPRNVRSLGDSVRTVKQAPANGAVNLTPKE